MPYLIPDDLFTRYMIAGAQASLAHMQAADHIVPNEDSGAGVASVELSAQGTNCLVGGEDIVARPRTQDGVGGLSRQLDCLSGDGVESGVGTAECELQIGMLYRLMSQFAEAERRPMARLKNVRIKFSYHQNQMGMAFAFAACFMINIQPNMVPPNFALVKRRCVLAHMYFRFQAMPFRRIFVHPTLRA